MMGLTAARFRDVLGRLAGGVTVVSALDAESRPRGFTATAVTSVSLEPPLLLVCATRGAQTETAIRATGRFAVNLLEASASALSERFATTDEGKFEDVAWRAAPGGSPLLPVCLAWAECELEREIEAGDHTVFIGRVLDGGVDRPEGRPLIHFRGRYHGAGETEP